MTDQNRKELLHKTGELYKQFIENQDEQRAAKLAAVMKKAADEEVYIAFTGHYSAGKSSLLNCLLMENILPTSPIPTSANLAFICAKHFAKARKYVFSHNLVCDQRPSAERT